MFEKYSIGLRLRGDAFRARKPIGTVSVLGGVGARLLESSTSPSLFHLRSLSSLLVLSARIFERGTASISRTAVALE